MAKKTDAKKCDVIVIGGGASGLMAAITAAENGASVTVLDHHPTPETANAILPTRSRSASVTEAMTLLL